MTLRHGRGHLYRALLEATAYGVRHVLEVMREVGGEIGRLVAVGGGTRGGLWTQIVSDVVGLPQQIPEKTIGASYGDAFLAALAVGLVTRETIWNPVITIVEPDASVRETYDTLYTLYRQLYPATREVTHRLAQMQEEQARHQ